MTRESGIACRSVAALRGLMLAACLVATTCAADAVRSQGAAGAAGGEAAPYNHILFVQYVDRVPTLVDATVWPDGGFGLRDILAERNLQLAWEPLCVVGGRLYGLKMGELQAIDVWTGRRETLCEYVDEYAFAEGRLWAAVAGQGGPSVLRVFDLRNAAYRDVAEVEHRPHGFRIAASPDGKRAAILSLTSARREGGRLPTSRMTVFDSRAGEAVPVPCEPIPYMALSLWSEKPNGAPPAAWLDESTVLVVRTELAEEGVGPD